MQNLASLAFDGDRSALAASLQTLAQRYRDRSLSGVLLFTDGLVTDEQELEQLIADRALPPSFPSCLVDSGSAVRDLRVEDVAVTETNFEEAPVAILARVQGEGFDKSSLVGQLRSETGELVESQEVPCAGGGESTTFRFQFRPAESGVAFYEFRVCAGRRRRVSTPARQPEATLVNNRRLVESESRQGPLSRAVCGRPPQLGIQVSSPGSPEGPGSRTVGLLRIAKREARFDFRGHSDETTNPLYRGFGRPQDEQAEQLTNRCCCGWALRDATELRGGFPRSADELFSYEAVVLDDVEAEFFMRDQLGPPAAVCQSAGRRVPDVGRGESFNSPGVIGIRPSPTCCRCMWMPRPTQADEDLYRLVVTQEGLLQPWVRLRTTEQAEQQRLDAMPPFHT